MIRCLISAVLLSIAVPMIGCDTAARTGSIPPKKTLVPDTSPSAHKMGNPG
jgi:hypothetical protein